MNIQELSFFCFTLKTTEVLARAGEVAILPSKWSTCSGVGWLYTRDAIRIATKVKDHQILSGSPRTHRLSLTDSCSLLIDWVIAEDASDTVVSSELLNGRRFQAGDVDGGQEASAGWTSKTRCVPRSHTEQSNCISFLKLFPVSYERK